IARALPAMMRQYARFDIDMRALPILVYPTQHYQNGGLLINDQGETGVPNLYAAGEVSGGVHGRNRLMGNSLLDILVFGRRAGVAAAERAGQVVPGPLTLEHVSAYQTRLKATGRETACPSPMLLPAYTRKTTAEKAQAARAA
ncbi:MAG TPA: FAD-binding protein, partial [Candidatus Sulfotelmatobacter sp.]|nr:FAD-binding protein [Candidatus Sulfotelmatobacter sp.]